MALASSRCFLADTAVMRDGTVQQFGPPLELYRNPVNTYVAGFLGSPSMNFVRGKIEPKGGSAPLFREAGGGTVDIELPGHPASAALAGREAE